MNDNLRWILHALSLPANKQRKRFPDEIPAAEELALEFEQHYENIKMQDSDSWSLDQRSALVALDSQLEGMSGELNEHLWLESDSLEQPEWDAVRILASAACSAFKVSGVDLTRPGATYVVGDNNG